MKMFFQLKMHYKDMQIKLFYPLAVLAGLLRILGYHDAADKICFSVFSWLDNERRWADKELKRREMEDMSKWPDGVYRRNEECPHCHSRDTSVAIHGAIRQWWCQSCVQPFMPKELIK